MTRPIRNLVLIFTLLSLSLPASALPASTYASRSKLASGKWVKISVDNEGIYQINYETLKRWGFPDPTKVAVYGYGGTAMFNQSFTGKTDDLAQTATLHTDDGRILFYSDGAYRLMVNTLTTEGSMNRNYYSDKAYYLLSDCESVKDIPLNSYKTSSATALTFHIHSDVIEKEEQNPARAGVFFHENTMQAGDSRKYSFHIRDYVEPGTVESSSYDRGVFRYLAALSSSNMVRYTSECTQVSAITNSVTNEYATTLEKSYVYETCKGTLPFRAGETDLSDATVTYTVTMPADASVTYAAIDRVQLLYPRTSRMHDDASLIMSYPKTRSGQGFVVYDASETTKVWNVTNPMSIAEYEGISDEDGLFMKYSFEAAYPVTTQTAARVIAFNPAATFPGVTYAGEVANQNIHGDQTPDMVIITTATFADQARQLAQIHKDYQGLDVAVYVHDDILNEFSSGTPHVMAYRRLAKMFYDRAPDKFKHLLFYGPTHFDNRSIVTAKSDRLLSFQTEDVISAKNPATNYSADVYFAMLNDNFNMSAICSQTSQINVGRIPVTTTAVAERVNEKIRRYLADLPGVDIYGRILSTSDDGDRKGHLMNAEETTDAMLAINPDLSIIRIHDGTYPLINNQALLSQKAIQDALKTGVGYFTYSGHGGGMGICLEGMWTGQLSDHTDYHWPGLAVIASCETFRFDRPAPNLSASLLFKLEGGCIGIIGAGRSVYMEHNQSANLAWAQAYASATPGTTIGDIFRNGRNSMLAGGSNDTRDINTLCYNLCGDPAIPVSAPDYKVTISTINGSRAAGSTPVSVKPLTTVTITGSISSKAGSKIQNFNGQIDLIIYDGPYSVAIRNESNPMPGAPTQVTLDEKILTQASATVVNGDFTATVTLPIPNITDVSNRIVACAFNPTSCERALGSNNSLVITAYDAEASAGLDTSAPTFESIYINGEDFQDGDIVDGSFVIYATINPSETGLRFTNSTLGNAPTATLDGSRSFAGISSYFKVDAEAGKAYLTYPMHDITDGEHTVEITVANNAGTTASASVNFIVMNGCIKASADVSRQTARKEAVIELHHEVPGDIETTLVIENADGTPALYRRGASFPFTWDLKDNSGNDVADGLYNAYVLIKAGRKYGSTAKTGIVVIR